METIINNILNKVLGKHNNKLEEKEHIVQKESLIITSVSELKAKIDNNVNLDKKSEDKCLVNSNYKLPNLTILEDDISKGIIPFIEKMKMDKKLNIPIGLNQDDNDIVFENISTMPNLLIGGTVMSGKTSYINTIISSILLSKTPAEIKLVIFDSKKVDYAVYNGIPHLLCPIISDSNELNTVLNKICKEIEIRMFKLQESSVKSLDLYNNKFDTHSKYLDWIVVIDEFSMLYNSDSINKSIEFITSSGWKVNIYLIISVNYPSTQVIPTVSNLNFPARLSFRVASSKASKLIVNTNGAEQLKGYGMALYTSRLNESTVKIKAPYITDNNIIKIVDYCCKERKANYSSVFLQSDQEIKLNNPSDEYVDPLYNEIVEFVVSSGKASASLLQRRFRLGYNRAAHIIDLLEEQGIIGHAKGSYPREVLVKFTDKKY